MALLVLSILPNINLRVAITAEQLSILPPADERIVGLRALHPNFDQFLGRFTGSHGRAVNPAVMVIDADAPNCRRSGEAMVGFRNAVAVSTVLRQTALELLYPRGHRILFSDPFDFYPWNLDRHFDRMMSITPASMALHRVDDFMGQPSPGSPIHMLDNHDLDEVLLAEILAHWDTAYSQARMSQMNTALFRSLNMASAAMRMPATTGATMFDYGRQCALWISAFEILAHFESGRANLGNVFTLLGKKRFHMRELNPKRYRVKHQNRTLSVTLPQKLYERLYRARNDFLHGNPVTMRSLQIRESGRLIGNFAPLLYRFALRNFLNLHYVPEEELLDLQAKVLARMAANEYEETQAEAEDALRLARVPPPNDD